MLGLQLVNDVRVDNRSEGCRRAVGEGQAPRRVALSRRCLLIGRRQLLQPELPHRLQHQVARLAAWTVLLAQQALLHQ